MGLTAMRYADGWCKFAEAMELQKAGFKRKCDEPALWKPPGCGLFKSNVDASVGREGKKGVGVVVCDEKGDIRAAACWISRLIGGLR